MLSVQLMLESSKRQAGLACRSLLNDAALQAAYCLDAPDEVQDGMEWWQDPEFDDVRGPVPRTVAVRWTTAEHCIAAIRAAKGE